MWEVFAFTSLIFAALGFLEYKKSSRSSFGYDVESRPLHDEIRLKDPYADASREQEEPQSFIKLRFSEDAKPSQPAPQPSSPPTFATPQAKEEAKRIWENHYIVKAVKERFAKGQDANYGVFHTRQSSSDASSVSSSSFGYSPPTPSQQSDNASFNDVGKPHVNDNASPSTADEPSSLLPALPTESSPNANAYSSNTSSGSSLPGVFGSLLQQRNSAVGEQPKELNLTSSTPSSENQQPNTFSSSENNSSSSEEIQNKSSDNKKVEEFNPFDVLGF